VKGLILIVLVLGAILVLLFLRKVRMDESRRKPEPRTRRRADDEGDA
jgi:hypothetical protein